MSNEILSSPDLPGWYRFFQNNIEESIVVLVTDDGDAFSLDYKGESYEIDDQRGNWIPYEFYEY